MNLVSEVMIIIFEGMARVITWREQEGAFWDADNIIFKFKLVLVTFMFHFDDSLSSLLMICSFLYISYASIKKFKI